MIHLFPVGLLFVVTSFPFSSGFNIDVSHPVIHSGPEGTMFGYSLVQLSANNEEWLLVGAPASHRYSQYTSGDVYMCRLDSSDHTCQPMDFHEDDTSIFRYMSNRTDQWMGATLTTSGREDASVMACAPRMWIHDHTSEHLGFMIGGCFVLKQDSKGSYTERSRYNPCVQEDDKLELKDSRQRMCQSGFSAVFDTTRDSIVMGCPSSYTAQGQLILQEVGEDSTSTQTGPSAERSLLYSYNGFSMTTGDFNKDKNQDFVSASPRMDLVGSVNFYEIKYGRFFSLGVRLTGEQMGEYFGYSLTVGDFNGDGFDDLAVGAPMYSVYQQNLYEVGRVYVFYQSEQIGFDEEKTILQESLQDQSRFGLAVASAGDLNDDDYGDLIVGAPYGGKDQKGVVYVYYGSISGLRPKVSQIIHGADFNSDISLFGYSLTGGLDQDRNGYKDVSIGAFGSNTAISLRSRPVVRVSLQMNLTTNIVDLQKKDCTLSTGKDVSCFSFTPCISFKGYNAPRRIEFITSLSLDIGKTINKRAYFGRVANNPYTHIISQELEKKRDINCLEEQDIYLKESIRDKLSPIHIQMVSTINEVTLADRQGIKAIQNQFTSDDIVEEVHILKFCGEDEVCIPDLVLDAKGSLNKITYGKDTEYELRLYALNQGEDSYETRIYTEFPRGINYINVKVEKSVTAVSCAALEVESVNSVIACNIGNPLPANQEVHLTLRASIGNIPTIDEQLVIKVNVNSTNQENATDLRDNSIQLQIDLAAEVELTFIGASSPKELLYNLSAYSANPKTLEEVGPPVTHLYELINNGPSRTLTTRVEIQWPLYSEDFSNLLYLVDQPRVLRGDKSCCNGQCTSVNVNPDQLNSTIAKMKRAAQEVPETIHQIICGKDKSHMCVLIECTVNTQAGGESSLIEINSRVAYETIDRIDGEKIFLQVASSAATTVIKVPYETKDVAVSRATFQITTDISASDVASGKKVKWWIILISVLAGLLLLIGVAVVLYKCGFFKRKIKEDMKRLTYMGKSEEDEEGEDDPMNRTDSDDV